MPAQRDRDRLPKRFQPLFDQAITEAAIRYGGQEDALRSLFGQTTRDFQRNSQSQRDMGMSLLGALNKAGGDLTRVYSEAGLTPEVLAGAGANPTLAKLSGELARGQQGIVDQRSGALAGQQYIQQRLQDDYGDDVDQISGQMRSLATERGLFESSLLDQLIGEDRSTRSKINADARARQFEADQAAIGDENAFARTVAGGLIGQGVMPVIGSDGSVSAGGKIPGAKSNEAARPKATPIEQSRGGTEFGRAVRLATQLLGGARPSPGMRNRIGQMITTGRPGSKGEAVYDPQTGKRKIDPTTGTQVTKGAVSEIKPVDDVIASAALDMVFDGHVSARNVKRLHRLGYTVRDFPGLKTQFDVKRNSYEERIKRGEVAGPPNPNAR